MTPKMAFHKMANIGVVFKFLEEQLQIKLLGIDTNDLVKKQEKQTINVLWNILRGLAMKGMQGDGEEDKNIGLRERLLEWTSKILEGSGISVKDFWESFKDGIAFCHIVDNLCPGHIDVDELDPANAESNLNLAFGVAESELGLPPLLQASDLAAGKKPDERSVMNYVCMLVSAAKANTAQQDKLDKLKADREADKKAKAAQLNEMKAQMEEQLRMEKEEAAERKAKMEEEIQANMERLKEMQEAASSTANDLESLRVAKEAEAKMFMEQMTSMRDTFEAAQQKQTDSFNREREELRAEIDRLNTENEELRDQLNRAAEEKAGLEDKITELTSSLYAAYKDNQELVENFRKSMSSGMQNKRKKLQEEDDGFGRLLKDSINQSKSMKDFVYSLPDCSGWLVKKRPDNKLFNRGSEKRYFTLKGDTLHWGKTKDKLDKELAVAKYLMIDRKGMEEGPPKEEAKEASSPAKGRPRRKSSVVAFKKGNAVIRLVPRPGEKAQVLELTATDLADRAHSEDLITWVSTLNTRISLVRYLADNFSHHTLDRGGREIVAFITDFDASELKIENKVTDIHAGLSHFKEPLSNRKGLDINLCNIAMTDADLEPLCEIIEENQSIRKISLEQNMFSEAGMKRLAQSLKKNKNVVSVNLNYNAIGDSGAIHLAEALYYCPKLEEMSLEGCGISDSGCGALIQGMTDSQKKTGVAHHFPKIDLSENSIGDPGMKAIARFLRKNESTHTICLNSNMVTDKGLGYVVEVMSKAPQCTLKQIQLANNQISSKGLQKLASLLLKDNLGEMVMDLSFNKLISSKGVRAILDTNVNLEFSQLHVIKKDANEQLEITSPTKSQSAPAASQERAAPIPPADESPPEEKEGADNDTTRTSQATEDDEDRASGVVIIQGTGGSRQEQEEEAGEAAQEEGENEEF
eukprot:CAMPEP_0175141880 /NCGR_PEP_ID=MMETSP0087-20121206/12398_1 /TAXON_ID=136419 /ORGANISM="Unknown Unknown, Strain D1" /LENGTH=920 /DNA_ID=CAMNT_0016425439 /DNA_START=235 /DNA_END=2997 /DNA_ORIENTATION=+